MTIQELPQKIKRYLQIQIRSDIATDTDVDS